MPYVNKHMIRHPAPLEAMHGASALPCDDLRGVAHGRAPSAQWTETEMFPRFVYLGVVRARFTVKTITRQPGGDPRAKKIQPMKDVLIKLIFDETSRVAGIIVAPKNEDGCAFIKNDLTRPLSRG